MVRVEEELPNARYRDGKLIEEDVPDCKEFWAEDSVAFLSRSSLPFTTLIEISRLFIHI